MWFNEALYSDVQYVRQYLDSVDVTGCDFYPVGSHDALGQMAEAMERWNRLGRGKPVWMVLQAFAWGEANGKGAVVHPTFVQSRFMVYDVIVHGVKGVLYWGSHYLKSDACRQSIYALTSELAALQPFLVAPETVKAQVRLVEMVPPEPTRGVRAAARNVGDEWLVVVVNEDDDKHMGVEVSGLGSLDGRRLELLYGTEEIAVERGDFVTRLQPFEVKVFATSRQWETDRREGRDFAE